MAFSYLSLVILLTALGTWRNHTAFPILPARGHLKGAMMGSGRGFVKPPPRRAGYANRSRKAAVNSATTTVQSPLARWRNRRSVPGYHGESSRPRSQRQSVL